MRSFAKSMKQIVVIVFDHFSLFKIIIIKKHQRMGQGKALDEDGQNENQR